MTHTQITCVLPDDLSFEISLAKRFTDNLGFLPREALEFYAACGTVFRGRENDQPAGFIVAAAGTKERPRIAQIFQAAVQMDSQRREHGLNLVAHVANLALSRGANAIQCYCAADIEANEFWRAAGFTNVGERRGGRRRDRRHLRWMMGLTRPLEVLTKKTDAQEARSGLQTWLFDL